MEDRLLDIKSIVDEKILYQSASQIRKMALRGEIPMRRSIDGGKWEILYSVLLRWIRERYHGKHRVDRGETIYPRPSKRKEIPETIEGDFFEIRSGRLVEKIH